MLGPRKDPAALGYKQRSRAEQSLRREPYITHCLHPELRGDRRRCEPESHQKNLGRDALTGEPQGAPDTIPPASRKKGYVQLRTWMQTNDSSWQKKKTVRDPGSPAEPRYGSPSPGSLLRSLDQKLFSPPLIPGPVGRSNVFIDHWRLSSLETGKKHLLILHDSALALQSTNSS